MKILLAFALILGSVFPGLSQFSPEQYLSAAVTEIELQQVRNEQAFVDNHSMSSPFLRTVEVRLRTNDTEIGPEDFRLRLSPLNPFEIRANRQHRSILQDQLRTQYSAELNAVFARRYRLLIDHYTLREIEKEIVRSGEIYTSLLGVNRNEKLADILKLDKAVLESRINLEEVRSSIREVEYLIQQGSGFSGQIDWDDHPLVSVAELQSVIDSDKEEEESIYIASARQRLAVDESRLNVEKAESFQNIGFLQAEYDTDRGNEFNEHMGFQLGIRLPIVNPDKPDLERRELDLINSQTQLEEAKQEAQIESFSARNKLEGLIRQYQLVTDKLDNLQQLDPVETGDIIEAEEYRLSLESTRTSIYSKILGAYISALEYEGRLFQEPFTNYLSSGLTSFSLDQ